MQRNTHDTLLYYEERGFVCPPAFWRALGYRGQAQFVALWWEATTDEACWGDGRVTYIGAEPAAFGLLLERNFAPGHPAHWLLGTSGTPATMWLLVERLTGRAWLVAADDGPELLDTLNDDGDVEDVAADGLGVVVGPPAPRPREVYGAWLEPPLSPRSRVEASNLAARQHHALAEALATAAHTNATPGDMAGPRHREHLFTPIHPLPD